MSRKLLTALSGFALAGVALATPASAYTWSDEANGIGHVGKGEVQSAFHWNNRSMQNAWAGDQIEFSVTEFEHWTQGCYKKKSTFELVADRERVRARNSHGVDAQNNQVTSGNFGDLSGFALDGIGPTVRETGGWGTNPWALLTNNGCPAGSHPSGSPVRTTTNGPLTVNQVVAGVVLKSAPLVLG